MASQVITAANKTVSFKSPYIGKTFQTLTENIFGREGLLSGGVTTDDGVSITVAPFKMVSRGIIGEALASSVVDVPTGSGPWYILASLPDDDPESGVSVEVTQSLAKAETGIVIAAKAGDVWRNPNPVDIVGAAGKAADAGAESGFEASYKNTGDAYEGTDGTTVVSEIFSNVGRVVTPDGVRIVTDSIDGESSKQLAVTPKPASRLGERTDRIVLRQNEDFSTEIAYLLGATRSDTNAVADMGTATAGIAPAYYGKRDGTDAEQWWAWADGADLKIYGGHFGTTFGETVLLTGTSIEGVWLVGQRADDAVLLLYIDNGNLMLVTFDAGSGAKIGTEIALEALPNAVIRATGALDPNALLRVVFEYDDGTVPSQQIYFGKFSSELATLGAVVTAPKYVSVNGSGVPTNSGFNDTKPQIGICRNGISHIAFIRGTGTNEYGDLVYARLDASDGHIESTRYFAATDVAEPGQVFVDFSEGISQVAYDSFTNLSLVVTPHDEIYVALGAGRGASTPDQGLLFSPELVGRIGFPIVQYGEYSGQVGIAILSGDDGEISVVEMSDAGGFNANVNEYWLGTQPGADANADLVLGQREGLVTAIAISVMGQSNVGPTGLHIHSLVNATGPTAVTRGGSPLSSQNTVARWPALHPNDILLSSIDVDRKTDGSGVVEEQSLEVFSSKKKDQSAIVVVGDGGDYSGYGSLIVAVEALSLRGGGTILLRGGVHRMTTSLRIPNNVSIIGSTGAIIDTTTTMGQFPVGVTVFGNVLEGNNNIFDEGLHAPGEWVLLDTSGWHQIEKILRPRESNGRIRYLISDGIDGAAPVGTTATLAATGSRLENVTLLGTLSVRGCRQCSIRNITIKGASSLLNSTSNHGCIFDGVDMTAASSGGTGANIDDGQYNTYKGFRMADDRARFDLAHTELYPTLIDCKGDNTNPAADVYRFSGTRVDPVSMIGCEGRVDTTSEDFVITDVGKLLRVPEGLGTMKLEDDLTRAASGPLELTGAAAAFDGATPQVIVDSVNERVRAAGDSMSGNLTTDGTTRTLGAAGVAGNRFNAYANILDVLGAATLKDRTTLGQDLLGSIANAGVARVAAAASVFAGVEYTLMWESVPAGQRGYRLYISATGSVIETVNAKWNNTANTWSKDTGQTGATATRREMSHEKVITSSQDTATNGWADAAWNSQTEQTLEGHTVADGVLKLGQSLIGAAADLHVPRIKTEHDSTVGERMLLWEMDNANQPTSPHKIRLYRSNATTEALEITFNCSWDNAANTWQWDNSSAYKAKWTFSRQSLTFYMRYGGGANNWTDTPDDPGGWSFNRSFNLEMNLASITVSDMRYKVINTTTTNNPAYNANLTGNTLYAKSIVKAWGGALFSSGGSTTPEDGFGWSSITRSGGRMVFTLKIAMANSTWCPIAQVNTIGSTTAFLGLSPTVVSIGHYDTGGVFKSVDVTSVVVRVMVCGQQNT
jgi:hypothetical protein